MLNKTKLINIWITPLVLGIVFIFLLADAPYITQPYIVKISSPTANSQNKTFLLEGVMFKQSVANNLFEEINYDYNIYDIKVQYICSGITNEISAEGTGFHFSAWIDLSSFSAPGITNVTYYFYGQSASEKNSGAHEFIPEDNTHFTTIVSN